GCQNLSQHLGKEIRNLNLDSFSLGDRRNLPDIGARLAISCYTLKLKDHDSVLSYLNVDLNFRVPAVFTKVDSKFRPDGARDQLNIISATPFLPPLEHYLTLLVLLQ